MFGRLFGRRKPHIEIDLFPFKDAEAAFKMVCKYMDTRLRSGANLYAIVVHPGSDIRTPIIEDERGIQTCVLKVSDNRDGFITMAQTAGRHGPRLAVGDAVIWSPMSKLKGEWIGLVLAKIEPVYSMSERGWKVVGGFDECPPAGTGGR